MPDIPFHAPVVDALNQLEAYYHSPHGRLAFDAEHLALLIRLRDALAATGQGTLLDATSQTSALADTLYRRSPRWRMRVVCGWHELRQSWAAWRAGAP